MYLLWIVARSKHGRLSPRTPAAPDSSSFSGTFRHILYGDTIPGSDLLNTSRIMYYVSF